MAESAKARRSAHRHEAKSFLREVGETCDQRGLRLTPLRLEVLTLIAHSDKPVKAYDLLERLKGDRAGAAPPTVYRALDFLLENGFIHKLESINAFVGCHHPSVEHHVPFLICDLCTTTVELDDERVSQLLNEQARQLGFRPQAQTLEVHGVCARCSAA